MNKLEYLNKELGTKYTSIDEVDWGDVSYYQHLTENFMRIFCDDLNWRYISEYQNLSEDFIREFQDRVDWKFISVYQVLSEDFIREFQDKVRWYLISAYQKLSEDFIREFKDKVDWYLISEHQVLSEDFIREFQDKVYWLYICEYQTLSEAFITEFLHKVNLDMITYHQKLSEEFRNKHHIKVVKEKIWLYKTAEEKKQAVMDTGLYECYDDYFIAYKAIRRDRCSIYNRQYIYQRGSTYSSSCNTFICEDSFGLSASTYEEACKYGRKLSIIVKVKIYYKDIGVVVHQSDQIRCFKLTVLE